MSQAPPPPGSLGWHDLTVEDAATVRDFYARVAGWQAQEFDMGGYSDYVMLTPDGQPVGGICHARGENADIPAAWMCYVVVPDLDAALAAVRENGGELVTPVKPQGEARYVVARDPAGAVFALYEPGPSAG